MRTYKKKSWLRLGLLENHLSTGIPYSSKDNNNDDDDNDDDEAICTQEIQNTSSRSNWFDENLYAYVQLINLARTL